MDHGFLFICQTETKRLLWLLWITFIVLMVVQYFELPYSSVFPFLRKGSSLTGGSSYEIVSNTTLLSGLNSSNPVQETTDNAKTYALKKEVNHGNEGKNGLKNDFLSEMNGSSNGAFGMVRNGTPFDNHVEKNKSSSLVDAINSDRGAAPRKARGPEERIFSKNVTNNNDSSSWSFQKEDISLSSEKNASPGSVHEPSLFALSPKISLPIMNYSANLDAKSGPLLISVNPNISSVHKGVADTFKKPGPQQSNITLSSSNSSMTDFSAVRQNSVTPPAPVMSISKMNDLLLQILSSPHSVEPHWSSTVDQELLYAKSQIKNAPTIMTDTELYTPLYRNVSMFQRSYEIMENTLKVYIYKEGEKPIFHQSILEGIYAAEGWFLKLLEANKQFVTENPIKAHLFYLPFSSRLLELTLYVRHSHSRNNLIQYMKNYVDMLAAKYPFWNRTDGADHFVTACHDWAPAETRGRMANCLRALCNADIRAGFDIGKDVSIPTTYVRSAQNPIKDIGGELPSNRPILAFFAGYMHGYVRPILLKYWGNKDPDMKIFSRMPYVKGNKNYILHMKSSKFCICARGFAVNSPRVVESIFYECVPVIISDNYVPPFFEVLNWESFAVFILEKDILDLKKILLSISEEKYLEMQKRVKKVQQHFLWHAEPVKFDLFHMILHSIWYNRVFQIRMT